MKTDTISRTRLSHLYNIVQLLLHTCINILNALNLYNLNLNKVFSVPNSVRYS